MYKSAASRLGSLKRSGTARYGTAASGVATRPTSGSFFSWLTGERTGALPPLEIPLGGVKCPAPLPDYVEPSKTLITTLPNGVRLASETTTNPVASVGLYLDCGSIYEGRGTWGSAYLLERLAFKSTTNRSHFRIVRESEAIGGSLRISVCRDQMGYTFDALKTHLPAMIELLVDNVRNPAFLDWEVEEQVQKVKAEIKQQNYDPQGLLMEVIHSTGYSGALGTPLLPNGLALNVLNGASLECFVSENFTAPRMVLAASGVEHEELISIAEPLLSDLPSALRPKEPKSVYSGGDFRRQAETRTTHAALAFEVPGGWRQEKQAVLMTVLQMLMGGGDSFSAKFPGKGLHSRLFLRVLNEYKQIRSISAFKSIFNDTGLFGIYASASSDFISKAVDIAAAELHSVATPGQVTQVQLNRAKESTKSAVLMDLEYRSIASEDIGRQILTFGERKPIEHYLKAVDEITLEDITNISQKIISSPLTMASVGDVNNVPSYDSMCCKFDAM